MSESISNQQSKCATCGLMGVKVTRFVNKNFCKKCLKEKEAEITDRDIEYRRFLYKALGDNHE